jgi:hypothetical protein
MIDYAIVIVGFIGILWLGYALGRLDRTPKYLTQKIFMFDGSEVKDLDSLTYRELTDVYHKIREQFLQVGTKLKDADRKMGSNSSDSISRKYYS